MHSQNVVNTACADITDVIGKVPYRMQFAGGWIDQPFVSKLNPAPPGSMVVVALEPTFRFMDRAGMGTSTRKVAMRLWDETLPEQRACAARSRAVRRREQRRAWSHPARRIWLG